MKSNTMGEDPQQSQASASEDVGHPETFRHHIPRPDSSGHPETLWYGVLLRSYGSIDDISLRLKALIGF